jgi:hypothetical protein
MTLYEIPIDSTFGAFTQKTVLDGVAYILGFRFNQTVGAWFMDISDGSNNPLLFGITLVLNFPLTYRFIGRISGLPPGQFVVADESGNDQILTRTNFGNGVNLLYRAVN